MSPYLQQSSLQISNFHGRMLISVLKIHFSTSHANNQKVVYIHTISTSMLNCVAKIATPGATGNTPYKNA